MLALRLPGKVAKQIPGEGLAISRGIISRIKAKLGLGEGNGWRWFTVTNVDNPLLEQTDRFAALVADELTKATGIAITKSDLAISASVPINGLGEKDRSAYQTELNQDQPTVQPVTT